MESHSFEATAEAQVTFIEDNTTKKRNAEKCGKKLLRKLATKSCAFFVSVYSVRISQGFYIGALSTTILFLAENVNASTKEVSFVFTGAAVGYLIGSNLASFVVKQNHALRIIGLGVFAWGVLLFSIPFIKSIALLLATVSVSGILMGVFDAGTQGIILKIWGVTQSRMPIQAFHFVFPIGAMAAPMIAKPFLAMTSVKNSLQTCPFSNISEHEMHIPDLLNETVTTEIAAYNPIVFAYTIYAGITIASSIFMLFLAFKNITKQISRNRLNKDEEEKLESRDEESVKKVLPLFGLYTLLLFAISGSENSIFSYLFAIAVCSELHFTEERASLLSSLFWCGFGLSRLLAIGLSRKIHPQVIIITCFCGCLSSLILLSLAGEKYAAVIWIGSVGYGFFTASIIPSSISWMVNLFNLSGKYVFIINLGNAAGTVTMVTISAVVFQIQPFAVVYTATAFVAFGFLIFFLMILLAKRQKRQKLFLKEKRSASQNSLQKEESM